MRVYALNTIHISRRVLIDSDGMDVRTYKCGYFHTILTEMMFMCVYVRVFMIERSAVIMLKTN